MRPAGATFWRLGGLSGWQKRTASADLAVSDRQGLQLAAVKGGPLSLQSADGSFGQLTLPRGMALDRNLTLHLLAGDGAPTWSTIRRYDGETRAFVSYARFEGATSIAIVRDWLYVTRPAARRVDVFDLTRSILVDVLEAGDWEPADVFAHGGAVYILDVHRGRVFRHAPYDPLELELERPARAGVWSRVAVDRDGTLYLFNGESLDLRNEKAPPVTDAGAIRDLFDPPIIRLDESGRFFLAASMAGVCGRSVPKPGPQPKPAEPALAARGDFLLYVVRRTKRRVDAYTDDGRHLRHSWGACMDWQPCDVAACGDTAFLLDEQNQIVYRHTAGREGLTPVILSRGDGEGSQSAQLEILRSAQDDGKYWTRIVCDAGTLLLYRPGEKTVQVFDCGGNARGERCYEDVRALFEATRPDAPAPIENGLYFDREGNPTTIDFSNPSGTRLYNKTGTWQSAPLDSKKYRCQWHRIELQLASFPPGSRISVATCAHEKPEDINDPTKAQFVDAQTIVAPIVDAPKSFDFLVQSGLGQHLTVRMKLESDGFSTPAVASAKIHYPRESYVEYLPSTYAADDESRIFLERFLSIFQTEWDTLDRSIDEIEARFDPDAVPEGEFLDHLAAQWLALPLEGDWDGTQRRRLVSAIPKIYPHRGKLRGLRDFIAVYLANMAGLETEAVRQLEFPVILEGFREREFLFGSKGEASRLGTGGPLWSASVKRRLQLGVYSTEGEAELVSSGDPEHDVFAEYAHRFRVYVPGAWVRSAANERMLRRALDAEKPAQTHYDLCFIEPRFRIGAQSTIGVDTVIGAAPSLRLGCPACTDAAPSLPPLGRLGYDTVLSADNRASAELVLA